MAERGILWTKTPFTPRAIRETFEDSFPLLVKVTRGVCGTDASDTLDNEQLLVIVASGSQTRVIAKNQRDRYFTIPLDFPVQCQMLEFTDNKVSTLPYIRDIMGFPQSVQFMSAIDVQFLGRNPRQMGPLDLLDIYQEKYLEGYFISAGVLDTENVLCLPLHVDVTFAIGIGLTNASSSDWLKYKQELCQGLKYVPSSTASGNTDIMRCQGKVTPASFEIEKPVLYRVGMVYSTVGNFYDRPIYDSYEQTPKQAEEEEEEDVYEVMEYTPPPPGHKSKMLSRDKPQPPPQSEAVKLFKKRSSMVERSPSSPGGASAIGAMATSSTESGRPFNLTNLQRELKSKLKEKDSGLKEADIKGPQKPIKDYGQNKSTDPQLKGADNEGYQSLQKETRAAPESPEEDLYEDLTPAKTPVSVVKPMQLVGGNTRKRVPRSNFKTIEDVPSDISKLSIQEVLDCLGLLNMESYVDQFMQFQIDGALLLSLDEKDLEQEFGMGRITAKKLVRFAREGWRPRTG